MGRRCAAARSHRSTAGSGARRAASTVREQHPRCPGGASCAPASGACRAAATRSNGAPASGPFCAAAARSNGGAASGPFCATAPRRDRGAARTRSRAGGHCAAVAHERSAARHRRCAAGSTAGHHRPASARPRAHGAGTYRPRRAVDARGPRERDCAAAHCIGSLAPVRGHLD